MIERPGGIHCRVQEVIEMTGVKKWLGLTAFVLAACSGKDVNLGGGSAPGSGGTGSVLGQVDLDGGGAADAPTAGCNGGCAAGERCCIVTVDVQSCTTQTQCLATSSCPPAPCEPAPPTGGADASTVWADGGSTVGRSDAGTTSALCGPTACSTGQDCCIVTIDVQSCTTGLQCVWGGCPPAPCEPHAGD